MALRICKAQTPSELDAVFRLRYEVYVDELGRTQRYADPRTRTIEEPFDRTGRVFCAFDGDRLIGAVRTNFARDSELSYYESLYDMRSAGPLHPHCTSVTTKLLVARDYRQSTLAYRLAAAVYLEGLLAGIEQDFVDVYPARVPFFERLGYRLHRPEVIHPEYGPVIVMSLALRDKAHLQAVKSPFLQHLLRLPEAAA